MRLKLSDEERVGTEVFWNVYEFFKVTRAPLNEVKAVKYLLRRDFKV